MLKLLLLGPRWAYLSIERFLAAQEAQAAALSRLAADLAGVEAPEEEESTEDDTWYDAAGEPLMRPGESFGVSEDVDEDELVFIQRIPRAKKPS